MADFKLDGEQGLAATALLDEALQSDSTMESLIRELVWRRDMMNPAARGDQKDLHPSSVQAVDGDEPVAFYEREPHGQSYKLFWTVPGLGVPAGAVPLYVRAAMKDKGHDN